MKKLFYLMIGVLVLVGMSYAQSINVTSPNGGTFTQSDTLTITWNVSGVEGNVKVVLRKADGSSGSVIMEVAAGDSPKSYSLATVLVGEYFIKVKQGSISGVSPNFKVVAAGGNGGVIDIGRLKDLLRRYRRIDWKVPGPWPGPGPLCLSCPPDFRWDKLRDIMKEVGLKEEITVEVVKGNEVFGKTFIGEKALRGRTRGMRQMKTMPKLRMVKLQKFSDAKGKSLRTGKGFKLVIKNAQGKVIAEQAVEVNQARASRRK